MPPAPQRFQCLPWSETHTGDLLKSKDPGVRVLKMYFVGVRPTEPYTVRFGCFDLAGVACWDRPRPFPIISSHLLPPPLTSFSCRDHPPPPTPHPPPQVDMETLYVFDAATRLMTQCEVARVEGEIDNPVLRIRWVSPGLRSFGLL
jgi:hypothetical protein